MNASAAAATEIRSVNPGAGVPFGRLVHVELRKLVDTVVGRWLLLAIGLITVAVVTVVLFSADASNLTFVNFVTATGTPQGMLLPVLGILSVTSEWGQRTALVTFALEPRRPRVILAKLLSVVVLGMSAAAVALLSAAGANLLGMSLRGGSGNWDFGVAGVRDVGVLQLIAVLQGVGFGLLLMSSAGAIVTYFALPIIWGGFAIASGPLRRLGAWIDVGTTTQPLTTHQMDGDAWTRLLVATFIWVLLPLGLGWMRLLHREIK